VILRRCLIAAACAVALVGPVVPAAAATDPCAPAQSSTLDATINVWQPGPKTSDADAHQCTPPAGSVLSGTWNIRIDAGSLASLRSFSVSVLPVDGSIPSLAPGATTSRTYAGAIISGKLSDTIQMAWDTGSLTRYNGEYEITATAVSSLGSTAHATVGHLLVNNPPAQPTGPGTSMDGVVPVLSWTANSEPDLTGYQVLRSVGGGPYAPAGNASTNTYRDTGAPQGKPLTYEVVAIRKSPADPNGIASSPSSPSSAVIAAPPVPTSTVPDPVPKGVAKAAPRTVAAPPPDATSFAPTLPYTQSIPTATATEPDVPAPTSVALPAGGGGYSKTTLVQKLPYLGAALAILAISFFLIRYAWRLRKGES